jgi:prepilin-type N-terminal cleavage/methylation domain-containing protein
MKKMNNKGFSLVELIIVIAIMAILVGVLAPQYLKYVEKSRVSADKDQLDSVYTACTTAASDADITDGSVPSAAGTVTIGGQFGSEVLDTLGVTDIAALKWKSKSAGAGSGAPTISADANGNFTVTRGSLSVPE